MLKAMSRYYTGTDFDFHNMSRMCLKHSVHLVRSFWPCDCNDFGDFQGRPKAATVVIDASTWPPQDPLMWKGTEVLWGSGRLTRKDGTGYIIAQDLTRSWPMARRNELTN